MMPGTFTKNPTAKPEVGENLINNQVLILKSLKVEWAVIFPIGGHSVTQTKLKYENAHMALTTHKFNTNANSDLKKNAKLNFYEVRYVP